VSEEHDHGVQVPRGALIGAAILIGVTLSAVAVVRLTGVEPTAQVPVPQSVVASRALRFEDRPNGDVVVFEAVGDGSDRRIGVLESGADGFVRGVLRSLVRARRAAGVGAEQPFLLSMQADGQMFLEDPATGQRIYLQAFGPSNVESFRQLLIDPSAEP
jgi:putative photosynthetic complex assembly protein